MSIQNQMKNQIDLGNVQNSENEQITSMEQLAPECDRTFKETIPQALCLETASLEECDYRFQEGGSQSGREKSAVNQNAEQPSSDGQVSQSKEPLIKSVAEDENKPKKMTGGKKIEDEGAAAIVDAVKAEKRAKKRSSKGGEGGEVKSLKEMNENKSKKSNKCKKKVRAFVDHNMFVLFMTIYTIYALWFDDIRMLAFSKSSDDIFYGITLVGIFVFAFEISLASYSKEEYPWTFFFYLDIISTVSMIPDCGWITDWLSGEGNEQQEGGTDGAAQMAKTSRAGRVTRVIRVIRLIRLIRIVKLYKQAQIAQQKVRDQEKAELEKEKKNVIKSNKVQKAAHKHASQKIHPMTQSANKTDEATAVNVNDEDSDDSDSEDEGMQDIPQESKISKVLSDKTTRTVVILVLCLLFLLPLCTPNTWLDGTKFHDQALKQLVLLYDNKAINQAAVDHFYTSANDMSKAKYPLIFFQSVDATDMSLVKYTAEDPKYVWLIADEASQSQNLRKDEYSSAHFTSKHGIEFFAIYSKLSYSRTEALINICRTTFICIILSVAAITFTKDAQTMVLDPLERMIEKVQLIAQNPLAAASDDINQAGVMSFINKSEENVKSDKELKEESQFETAVLEKAIVKIGHLLALGFGEAGAGIIGQNMKRGGDLDPMMPGQKTYAIFGFCILDHFNETTEVLQSDIMMYVNQVAEITHSMVDRYGGAANKNIGEAFLLVWKFKHPEELLAMDESGEGFNNESMCIENQILADTSIFSFLKIIAKLNKYEQILRYNSKKHKLSKHIPGFKVKMGFGIHQGWAIEGAIGSYFKVDASYLSPNVNMAARLEAATKQFGTTLLVSGHLRDITSPEFQLILREIDCVTVKGSIKPMRFYTIDHQIKDLERTQDPLGFRKIAEKKAIRDKMRKDLFAKLEGGIQTTWDVFSTDHEFLELRKHVDPQYELDFADMYKDYIGGDWPSAGKKVAALLEKRPDDGPTVSLNKVINIRGGATTPEDWKGYRALTSK